MLFLTAAIILCLPYYSYSQTSPGSETERYDRADAEIIKVQVREILSQPEFSPTKTFWQWLSEKLSRWNWEGPKFNLGYQWKEFFLWVAITWCVLALAAILIHVAWTASLLFRTGQSPRIATRGFNTETARITSFDELYLMACNLAEKKAFREAISLLILALLRWLDYRSIIRFHESKTNGDYAREFPSVNAGRGEFMKFISMFEQTIYGRRYSDEQTYRQMNFLMEQIQAGAAPKK